MLSIPDIEPEPVTELYQEWCEKRREEGKKTSVRVWAAWNGVKLSHMMKMISEPPTRVPSTSVYWLMLFNARYYHIMKTLLPRLILDRDFE